MKLDQRIVRNFISLLGVQGVNYVFPLLTVAIVARALGVEYLGFLIIAQAIAMYVQQATDFGFNLTATRRVALCHGDFDSISEVFTSTLLAKIIVFIAAMVFFLLASLLFESVNNSFELVLILLIGVFSSIFYPVWLFQGVEKMQNIFIGNLITKSSSLFLMFLLVDSPDDINVAGFIQSLSWFLVAVYSLFSIHIHSYCTLKKVKLSLVVELLKESFYIYLSVLATSFYTAFNVILLGSLTNAAAVAVYGIADKLRAAAQAFIGVFSQALYPYFCSKIGKDRFGFWLFLTIGCVSGGAFYLLSPLAIFLLAGDKYQGAIEIAQIFSVLCPIISVASYLANLRLAAQGHQKIFLKIYVAGALIHLSYVYFFIGSYGSIGLSISVILTEAIVTLLLFIGVRLVVNDD